MEEEQMEKGVMEPAACMFHKQREFVHWVQTQQPDEETMLLVLNQLWEDMYFLRAYDRQCLVYNEIMKFPPGFTRFWRAQTAEPDDPRACYMLQLHCDGVLVTTVRLERVGDLLFDEAYRVLPFSLLALQRADGTCFAPEECDRLIKQLKEELEDADEVELEKILVHSFSEDEDEDEDEVFDTICCDTICCFVSG